MNNERIAQISFLFPQASPEGRAVCTGLVDLFAAVNGSTHGPTEVLLRSAIAPDALPVTSIQLAGVDYPQVIINGPTAFDIAIGLFHLATAPVIESVDAAQSPSSTDAVHPHQLRIDQISEHLRGNIARVDHTGVNLPAQTLAPQEWDGLVANLAAHSNVYRYPTGEPWPFIVPATKQEFEDDIHRFDPGREPKFELVYDTYLPSSTVVLQFDVETTLERAELEACFPAPYGVGLPGLEEFFRSVYVRHPWPNLALRLDLRYRPTGEPDAWETTEWLIHDGGRIR